MDDVIDELELELFDRPLTQSDKAALERLLHDRKAQKRLTEEFRDACDRHRADLEREREAERKRDEDISEWFAEMSASFYQGLDWIDNKLSDISIALEERRQQLEAIDREQQANADQLPGGGLVFWSEDGGHAIYADGSPVPAALLDSATHRPGAATAEQREAWLQARAEQERLEREERAARAESARLREEGITPENAREQREALQRLRERVERLGRDIEVKPDIGLLERSSAQSATSDLQRRFSSANSFAAAEMPAPVAPEDLPALRDGFTRAADRGANADAAITLPNLVPPVDPRKILGLTS